MRVTPAAGVVLPSTALAIGGPAVPFVGVMVLGYLYGPSVTAVPVAVGALVFNVIERGGILGCSRR